MKKEYSDKFYRGVKGVSSAIMQIIFKAEIIDKDNIPIEGPIVLAGNHKSMLDIPLIWHATDRNVRFMAKKEIFDVPIISYMGYKVGAFPVNRDKLDIKAVKQSLLILLDKQVLGIFPEGTRNKEEELLPLHLGATNLAIKTKALVVPFGISGEYRINGKITIRFGKAIDFSGCKEKEASEYLRAKIMELKKR